MALLALFALFALLVLFRPIRPNPDQILTIYCNESMLELKQVMLTKKRHLLFATLLLARVSSLANPINQTVDLLSLQAPALEKKNFSAEFQSEMQEYRNKSGHSQGAEIDHDLTFGVQALSNVTIVARARISESLYPAATERYRNTKNSLGAKWSFSAANLNWKSKTLISSLTAPAGTELELEFKSKYRISPSMLYRLQVEHKENPTPGAATLEKRQIKLEVTPMYTQSKYSLGLQSKWLARAFTTGQDEYGLDLAPIAKYEGDSYEVTLRQVFRPYRSSRKTLISWESESTSSLKVEISKEF